MRLTLHRLLAYALLAYITSGCATAFYNAQKAGPQIETAARLPAGAIKYHSSCSFAFAGSGASKADFTPGACAYTDSDLYVLSWDATRKAYRREIVLPIARLKGVAKATSGPWMQVQTPVDGGLIVIEGKGSAPIYQQLRSLGIKEWESPGYINTNLPPQPTTIYVPVYVGG